MANVRLLPYQSIGAKERPQLKNAENMVNDECKIDSLRLFLPLDKITLNNQDDYTNLTMNKGSAEIIKESLPSIFYDENGIVAQIKVDVCPWGRGSMAKGIVLPIHAKMLGSNYFDGINKNNIRDIHQFINSISTDLIIPMESLLFARASDVDFCCDGEPMEQERFKVFKKELSIMCQASGVKNYNPSKKTEFYIQSRPTARLNTPFAKIYQKLVLYGDSDHQKKYYPNISELKNWTRAEVTMKNKSFLTKYSNDGIRSSQLLHVLEGDYKKIVKNVFEHYFVNAAKKISPQINRSMDKLKPLDAMICSQFKHEIIKQGGMSKINVLDLIQLIFERNTCMVPTTKARLIKSRRKQITSLFYEFFDKNTLDDLTKFNDYLKKIGLMN